MLKFFPEGAIISSVSNRLALSSPRRLKDAMLTGSILEAKAILCDKEHNLHVDLGCMRGIIPHSEGGMGIAEGRTKDIAVISRVNKPVCFKILDIEQDSCGLCYAVLSRRKVQEECYNTYIKSLSPGDIIDARVTHLESFGAFCDVGCGIVGLLPIDCVSVSRIPHPTVRLHINQSIKVCVKAVDEQGRLLLSMKELLGTWEENTSLFAVGETVPGIIRSIESYGVFVELTPNLAGLAEYNNTVKEGEHASVFIKSIIPEKMKVKLIIVDSFRADYPPSPLHFFVDKGHIERFVYSPKESNRLIETVFN